MHDVLVFAGGFFIGLVFAVCLQALKEMQSKSWLPEEE